MASFSGSFSSGSFSVDTSAPIVVVARQVGGGGTESWRDSVEARYRKVHLRGQIAKAKRKLEKLEKEEAKVERKIEAESRQGHEIDGILYKHQQVVEQIYVLKSDLRVMSDEYSTLLKYVGERIKDDDEEDIEILLLS